MTRSFRTLAVVGGVAAALTLSACSSDDTASTTGAGGGSSSSPTMSSSPSESMTEDAMSAKPFGAGCAAVPASGKGSFQGMSTDPVATAASNNPALSTLVTAVKTAGLVDTLNSAQDITVLAPTNDAFKAMDQATLKKALGDKKLLSTVLTYHVIKGKLSPDQLTGMQPTLQGGMVDVTGSGEAFTVDGKANVVCGNVQTANATVYLIDQVLMPKAA